MDLTWYIISSNYGGIKIMIVTVVKVYDVKTEKLHGTVPS